LIFNLPENNPAIELLANVQSSGRLWVYWAVEIDNEGKLNFGLQKCFQKIIRLFFTGC